MDDEMDVMVYASGPLCCSVCAPPDMAPDEVARRVEAQRPAGTERGWRVSEDTMFADGETPNGGIVACNRGDTRHWLLDC